MWNSNGSSLVEKAAMMMRHFSSSSRKRAPNLRKINPRVPYQEAASMAEGLYGIIKTHGPLSIGTAWNHAKDSGINGLSSKTHMKLLLKWMQGRRMLKQICNHVGSNKKFLLTTLPAETQENQQPRIPAERIRNSKTPSQNRKLKR